MSPFLKTSDAQRAALKRYRESAKGRAAQRRYLESPAGRASAAAARRRYNESVKGRSAKQRARDARNGITPAKRRELDAHKEAQRAEARRRRIMLGLPPEPPTREQWRAAGGVEASRPELSTPEAIAAALALEDLR